MEIQKYKHLEEIDLVRKQLENEQFNYQELYKMSEIYKNEYKKLDQ